MEYSIFKISTLRVVDTDNLISKMSEEEKQQALEKYSSNLGQYYVNVVYDNGVYKVVGNVEYFYVILCLQKNLVNVAILNDEVKEITSKLLYRAKKEVLNPMLAAFIYYEIKQIGGISQEEISNHINKTQGAISNKIRLTQLPIKVQVAIIQGQIKERHGRALLQLRQANNFEELAVDITKKIIVDKLKVDETDDIIAKILGKSVGKRENLKIVNVDEKNQLKRKEMHLVINEITREIDDLQQKLAAHFPKLEFEKEQGTNKEDYVFLIKMKGVNK